MSKSIEFPNGFKAQLDYNTITKEHTLRLYSPSDVFLASIPSDEEHFHVAADGLLAGYFAGWRDCKHRMTDAVSAACKIDIATA